MQQRAAQAGLTVSEYLWRKALDAGAHEPGPARAAAESRTRVSKPTSAGPLFPSSARQNSSAPGGWFALLRNRFLASPARLAERAQTAGDGGQYTAARHIDCGDCGMFISERGGPGQPSPG